MQKNELLRKDDKILRVLEIKDDTALVVDCFRKTMPMKILCTDLEAFQICTEQDFFAETGNEIRKYDSLDQKSRRFVHEHFTMIAGILPFIGNERMRCAMIASIASEKGISKQTIRNYLWLYLVYQDIAALAPKQKTCGKALNQDQKNMRWALNKFFYTKNKNSLTTAYTLMLKEKYCDASGKLLTEYPSIHQFRYFYKKHNKLQTYYISREGLKKYQRDYRPLLGDGIQAFAPAIGVGMLDATVCDIYLIDDAGNLVGRPILTACVDAYSGMCCGYSLSWEGGVYSLRNLMVNVIADKVEWCRRFGIGIKDADWSCNQLPATLVTDMGAEYKSETFEQIAELGVTVINLPPYRPELKGRVEKFFDLIQSSYKGHLKGKGVIEPDFQERGVHDYRKDACLTMYDFEKIILHCILYYNNHRILKGFVMSKDMLNAHVEPYSSSIWKWGKSQAGANLISVSYEDLVLTLLPRTIAKFTRNGLMVNKLRYKNEEYTEQYLQGGTVTVGYNPDDVSCVWLKDDEIYKVFTLVENAYKGFKQEEVDLIKESQKSRERTLKCQNIQAKIDLAEHIKTIASVSVKRGNTSIKRVRKTRSAEQRKNHVDFVKGGTENG